MKKLLICIILLYSIVNYGQENLVIGKSEYVSYHKSKDILIDSVVTLSYRGSSLFDKDYKVFFDDQMTKLAFELFVRKDTVKTIDYWRNEKIKQVSLFKIVNKTLVQFYNEIYCDNGQLIRSYYPNKPGKVTIEHYYCNGSIMNKIERIGTVMDGSAMGWYDNGVQGSEMHYKNNVKVGKWKYWNREGILIKEEVYQYGRLIETITYQQEIKY